MNSRLLISIAALALKMNVVQAQNVTVVLPVGDSVNGVVKVKEGDNYCDDCLDYKIPAAPQGLISAIPFRIHYQQGANFAVNCFQNRHLNWGFNAPSDFFYPVKGGLNGAIPIPEEYEEEYGYVHYQRGYDKLKEVILGSSFVRELIYDWLMPSYVNIG